MAYDQAYTHDLILEQVDRPLVGVSIDPNAPITSRLLDRFAELRWQVIDLNAYGTRLPGQIQLTGAIVSCLPTQEVAPRLLDRGVPTIRLGFLPHPDDPKLPAVIPDLVAEGRLAAEHFAERGFEHLGFVGYTPWHGAQGLYEGFAERAEQLGCHCHLLALNENELHAQVTDGRDLYDVQKQHVHDWWRSLPRPLGLLANGDMAAHRFCQWAVEAALRVPEDVAILGRGNVSLTCQGAIVPLSSIDRDEPATIDAAIDALGSLVAGRALTRTTIPIPPRGVVVRRSTDVLAASDIHVVKALRFMWDHVSEDLSVDQIAAHVGVSRRTLAKGFQRDLGRGVNAEFQRRRLEKARELILKTDLPIGQIAAMLSFSSQTRLTNAFKRAYGQTPAKYRRQSQPSR